MEIKCFGDVEIKGFMLLGDIKTRESDSLGIESGVKVKVIKRNGRNELFNDLKVLRILDWASNGNRGIVEQIYKAVKKQIYDGITTKEINELLFKTALQLINPLVPEIDEVARNLLLMMIYKESHNIPVFPSDRVRYPDYKEFVKKSIEMGLYSNEIFGSFTDEELEELGRTINPQYDLNFSTKGLYILMKKYAIWIRDKNGRNIKYWELPQHTYMRVAIQHFWQERNRKKRLEKIKQKYKYLAEHYQVDATPKMLNSGTTIPQLSSCVLMTIDDDTFSILETAKLMGVYSKYSGGLAVDVSRIRARGSLIRGNRGVSNGTIPFIKIFESVVSSFNQMGLRKGACAVYYPFWHMDVEDLVMLKDTGGSEELRARKLQYAFKWYRVFTKRILEGKDITLFDPKEVQKLNETWGDEFERLYIEYENRADIRKKRINSLDLVARLIKQRVETGNIYIAFIDNINEQRLDGTPVFMSNLCTEVVIPSQPAKFIGEKYNEKRNAIDISKQGRIGLCNLSSIDLVKWSKLSDKEKREFILNLLEGFDNLIENQYYPVKEAEIQNKEYRPIGIGVYNYALLLAEKGVDFISDDAKEITHNIFEDLLWYILWGSSELAKERGTYKYFEYSKWKEGLTPIDVSILHNRVGDKRKDLNRELKKDWDYIKERLVKYGVRFSYHLSIAPTNTSAKVVNALEGIEPPLNTFIIDEGTYTIPTIVPNLKKYRIWYMKNRAWDIPPKTLIELASIRQKFIDQSQSLTLYYKNPAQLTMSQLLEDIIYAEMLGLKTLYYLKTQKSNGINENDDVICESCVL